MFEFHKRYVAVAAELVAAGLFLAACGGGNGDTVSATEASAATSRAVAHEVGAGSSASGVSDSSAEGASGDREAAAAAVGYCPSPINGPKVAALDFTGDDSAARKAVLSKFDLAVLKLNAAKGANAMSTLVNDLKRANPNMQIGQYLVFAEMDDARYGEVDYELAQELTARNWWLRKADGSRSRWTTSYNNYDVNLTGYTQANPSGQRWPQFKAAFDTKTYFRNRAAINFAVTAHTWATPRVDADWKGWRSNQSRNDTTVASAMRSGHVAYWNALRAANPSLKVMGVLDNTNDLSSAEQKGQAEGAMLDAMIGQSWSLESLNGWDTMMKRYRAALANTKAPKTVVFSAVGAPTDYATMRYGLASALLEDGYFLHRSSTANAPQWYDEYSAPLGAAAEGAPTAAASNGIWKRAYANGMVLVNPQRTTATITLPAGYQRLKGTQDPGVNSGASVNTLTMGPRSGLILVKQTAEEACNAPTPPSPPPPPVEPPPPPNPPADPPPPPNPPADPPPPPPPPPVEPPPPPNPGDPYAGNVGNTTATPRVAALEYSWNVGTGMQAALAKFDIALIDKGRLRGAAAYNRFADGVKARNPNTQIAHYVINTEVKCSAGTSAGQWDTLVATMNRNDWWLRKANGTRAQWTTIYNACDTNPTHWGLRNAAGQTFIDHKWQSDRAAYFGANSHMDYVHVDNVFVQGRSTADYKRNGTNQNPATAELATAYRAGYAKYFDLVRQSNPELMLTGNTDNDLSSPEYKNKLNGALLEAMHGLSWSMEGLQGWVAANTRYAAVMRNTLAPHSVMYEVQGNVGDYAAMRYGLASSLMGDGYYIFRSKSNASATPSWYDEYDAKIGKPLEAQPSAATQNGIWTRRYSNGLVLVNPSRNAAATITLPAGYKRINGTQDRGVNNGQAVTSVTMTPRSGLILIRQ